MASTIERELDVVLTEEEKNEAGRKCADEELELRAIENDFRETAGGFRKRLKEKRALIKDLAEQAKVGRAKKKVPCEERTDWPRPTVVVRLDGRDVDGSLLPWGSPPAVIETKPPEVQEVEKDRAQAAAGPTTAPEEERQRDLFQAEYAAPLVAPPASEGEDSTGGVNEDSASEDLEELAEGEAEAEDELDEDEEAEVEEPEEEAPPPVPAPVPDAAAAKGSRPRKLKLVGAH